MSDAAGRHDEMQLLADLKDGDEAAFQQLIDMYGPMLLRIAMMHVPSRAVAEEVLQDTWLAVLNGIDGFEGRSSLKTWITSILLNTARTRGERERRVLPFSLLRRRDEDGRSEPSVPPDRFQGSDGEYPGHWARPPLDWGPAEDVVSAEATRKVLLDAVAALPPRQRDVIALRDISGWTSEEVRNALDLSETNQRVILHRARSKVRAALEEHFAAGEV